MPERVLTEAEIMLDNLAKIKPLIRQLQAAVRDVSPVMCTDLSKATRAKIASYQSELQRYINSVSAQREEVAALVRQIPDQTAQDILLMRYGLSGSGRGMSWVQMEMQIPYCSRSIHRYHKKGIAQLNQILESKKAGEQLC